MSESDGRQPRIADDFSAINRRMREIQNRPEPATTLPAGVKIMIASKFVPPYSWPRDITLGLILYPLQNGPKLVLEHLTISSAVAVQRFQQLIKDLSMTYPSLAAGSRVGTAVMSPMDCTRMIQWLDK